MNWLAKIIEYALVLAVIAAGVWFGAPAIWGHIQAGQQALVTAHAQAGAISSDTASANRAQTNCSAELNHAADAFKAIAKASQVQPAAVGQGQPLITADQIRAMIQ